MRVLALTNLYPNPFQPNRGTFNGQQFRALAEQHAVRVISPISWVEEFGARWRGAPAVPRGRSVPRDGIVVDYPRYIYPPKVLRGWYGRCLLRSVRAAFDRACDEFRPDVVLSAWAYPDGWAAAELAHRRGLPVVTKVHGCDVLCGGAGLESDPTRRRLTAEALTRADAVVAVSGHLAGKVAELGVPTERVHVVYCGIDSNVFHPGSSAEARTRLNQPLDVPTILFVGNLVPVKGIEVLIDACARLVQRGVRFAANLIGQGPLQAQLQLRIQQLGIGEHVRLLGTRPHHQLSDWFRAATVFALPSRSEGVPSVLLEAAACGTPFVASRVGGIPEIAHLGSSRLVPPGDPDALADALAGFLTASAPPPPPPAPRTWADSAADLARVLESVVRAPAPPDHQPAHELVNCPAESAV